MADEPLKLSTAPHTVSWQARIPASALSVWEVVSNPHRHHEFDGSGTVRSRAVGAHELSTGARFTVSMKKFRLPYRLPLKVTQARRPSPDLTGILEWRQPTGHRWRWEFEEIESADGSPLTLVTETYDATGQAAPVRLLLEKAGVERDNSRSIRASLQRLGALFGADPA